MRKTLQKALPALPNLFIPYVQAPAGSIHSHHSNTKNMFRKIMLLLLWCMGALSQLQAQVGIGTTTPNNSAQLEIQSTSKGLLLPRMTAAQRAAISNPAQGLLVYQIDGSIGIYHFDGTYWRSLTTGFIPNASGQALVMNPLVSTVTTTGVQVGRVTSVAVDQNGNLYTAEYMTHTVRKIAADGTASIIAGDGTAGFQNGVGTSAKFNSPYGVAVDASGNVYVADAGNHMIRKIAADGTVSTVAGTGAAGFLNGAGTTAQFNFPAGLALDKSGALYVSDASNNRIRKIIISGSNATVTTFAGSATEGFVDGPAAFSAFDDPFGLTVDAAGTVYVSDFSNNSIRKIFMDIDGVLKVKTIAGFAGVGNHINGPGTTARFNGPYGVAVDAAGNLYVSELGNKRVRKVTPESMSVSANYIVTDFAGDGIDGLIDGPAATARFRALYGIAIDGSGTLYVADGFNNVVRKITY
jgi:sugar lactone lactonase YvrE